MDYTQAYTGYQNMAAGYNSAYHYQYATPNHLKVSKIVFDYLYILGAFYHGMGAITPIDLRVLSNST